MERIPLAMWLVVAMFLVALISIIIYASLRRTGGWLIALGALLFVVGLGSMAATGYDATNGSVITFAIPLELTTTLMFVGLIATVIGLWIAVVRDLRRGGYNEVPPESEHQEVSDEIVGEGTPTISHS